MLVPAGGSVLVQLGKLRAFGADWDVDLDGQRNCSRVGGSCFPVTSRCSPLDLVRLWCSGDLGYGKSGCAITLWSAALAPGATTFGLCQSAKDRSCGHATARVGA